MPPSLNPVVDEKITHISKNLDAILSEECTIKNFPFTLEEDTTYLSAGLKKVT